MTSERNVATSETINRFRIRWVVLSINVQAFTYEVFVVRLAVGAGVVTVVVGVTVALFRGAVVADTVFETAGSFTVCVPATVGVRWAQPVAEDFHARYSAYARCYRYLLINEPQRSGVWQGRTGWYHHPLDAARMQAAADLLLGEHDFSSFRAAECQAKSPVKTMRLAAVRRAGKLIIFDFEAGAFLQHMVRNLVGSLVYIGQGKHAPEWMAHLLQARERRLAAPTFSAAGLYLAAVRYDAHWGLPASDDALLPALSGLGGSDP